MQNNDFQQTVTFADGTVKNGNAALNEIVDELWVYFADDMDILDACTLLCDTDKTQSVSTCLAEGIVLDFDGYTVLTLVRTDGGKISARLKKGA